METTELKHEHEEASSTLPSELTSEENGTTTGRKRELPEDHHHEADSEPNLKHPKLEHGSPEPENENEIGNGEGGIEGEDGEEAGGDEGEGSPSQKDNKRHMMIRRTPRKRLIWTQELHTMFIETVNRLGNKAVPTTILQEMNVQGLTRENIASHLQKYRLQLKKLQKLREGPKDHEGGATFADPMMQQYKAGAGAGAGSSVRAQILDTKHHQVLQQLLIPGTNLPAGVHVSLEDLAQASNDAQAHAIAANAATGATVVAAAGGDTNDQNHQHQNDGSQLTYTVPVSHLPFLFQQAAGQSVPYVLPQYQYRVPGVQEPLYYLQPYDGGTASYLAKLVPGTTIIPVSQLVPGSPATTGAPNTSSSTAPSNPSAGTNPSSSPSSALAGPPPSQIPAES